MSDATVPLAMTRRTVLGMLGLSLMPGVGAREAAAASDADQRALVASNSEFGIDLYGKLRATKGNLIYSPYSISQALTMTSAGARGATADEMAKTLHFSLDSDRLHPAFAGLMRDLNGGDGKRQSELSVANALWSQKGYPFVAKFQEIAKTKHGAGLEEVDFAGATEAARRTINAWVAKQTRDKIKELFGDGALSRDTVLALTNAIYFKGLWRDAFSEEQTRPADFELGSKGVARNVPLMRNVRHFRYLEDPIFQALDLPYAGNEMSMIVFLPRSADGLPAFEKNLTAAQVSDWIAGMKVREVDASLPRFKATAEFQLNRPLIDLGMRRAFSAGDADFSGMVTVQRICLSTAVHKAYVEVNEKGTEAAAATGIAAIATSAGPPPPTPVVFRADHPFFFLIRDNRTGSMLFAGRLVDPRKT